MSGAVKRDARSSTECDPLLELSRAEGGRPRKPRNRADMTKALPVVLKNSVLKSRAQLRFLTREQQFKKQKSIFTSVFESDDKNKNKNKNNCPRKKEKTRSWVYNTLNPRSHNPSAEAFKRFIALVILIDVGFFFASTEPSLSDLPIFYYTEGIMSCIFLVEYVARLVVCIESIKYARLGPIRGRIKYLLTTNAIIDALATLPFFIEWMIGIPLPTTTYVRVFRLLRITKTSSYCRAFDAVWRVFSFNREILNVAGLLGLYLVIFTSILMYYLRPRGADIEAVEDQEAFESIPRTMYMSVLMLTGQGGPTGGLPWYTQIVVLLTGVFSLGMFAIPASMLTWGFEAEAQRLAMRASKKLHAKKRKGYVDETSSSSSSSEHDHSSSSIDTSDEEYMNIIGDYDDSEGKGGNEESLASWNQKEGLTVESLGERMDQLERKVDTTNEKLDLLLTKFESTMSSFE